MKTYIVLFPISSCDRKTDAESIEGETFNDEADLSEYLASHLASESNKAQFYTISEFTTLCNNEEFEPNDFWIAYVNVIGGHNG